MRIFLLLFACTLIFAQDINLTKGQALFLNFEKQDLLSIQSNGKKINYFNHPKDQNTVTTIIAIPYKRPENKIIQARYKNNKTIEYKILYQEGNYQKERLQVAKSKVAPPKSVQARIKKEFQEANKIYQSYTSKALFNADFIMPLNSTITSDFGKARIFNNTLSSYHSGTDFKAAAGTPIYATNSGIVKIAKDRYYAGKSVVIDHGQGIFSQYYHLEEIKVKVGQRVKKGELIGLSGSSGRVTGPHLHFGILVNNTQVDPLDFIQKFNTLYQ
ncbi:M23 family metallopeptidase [Campylobacter sp. US33a]|uniref:M23 family metallopeptidase n=1 Tax=Campylobacter sp. US33a TaxID=2498120 RepID=UPI0010681F88|nr:M23 family metallopeptidase [Campylobacter sp. US33a]TEY02682.1 M23 family metallopeptidase [Campylobacter sp. US33a]